jgi:hypothetical protein
MGKTVVKVKDIHSKGSLPNRDSACPIMKFGAEM